jgi:hypothetical protein
MTDERPRPAYGEYATPEQQAAAMGVHRLEPASTAIPLSPPPPYGRTVGPRPPAPSAGQQFGNQPGAAQPTSRRWDLFLTSLLIAYGLWSVISGIAEYSNLSSVAQKFYTTQGLGTFTSSQPSLGTSLGLVINITGLVIFVVVVLLAYRLLRRGRIAFWVPLTGGVLAAIITVVCLMTYMFSDPAFAAHLSNLG